MVPWITQIPTTFSKETFSNWHLRPIFFSVSQLYVTCSFLVFHSEVLESLQRGAKEGVNADNLSLEVNSSRHAYAVTPNQVTSYTNWALLTLDSNIESKLSNNTFLNIIKILFLL